MQIRPNASLSRDSPSRRCIKHLGIGTRAAVADTATGSVGETESRRARRRWRPASPGVPNGDIVLPGASRAALEKLPIFLSNR
jgi:hypothetical protein